MNTKIFSLVGALMNLAAGLFLLYIGIMSGFDLMITGSGVLFLVLAVFWYMRYKKQN